MPLITPKAPLERITAAMSNIIALLIAEAVANTPSPVNSVATVMKCPVKIPISNAEPHHVKAFSVKDTANPPKRYDTSSFPAESGVNRKLSVRRDSKSFAAVMNAPSESDSELRISTPAIICKYTIKLTSDVDKPDSLCSKPCK